MSQHDPKSPSNSSLADTLRTMAKESDDQLRIIEQARQKYGALTMIETCEKNLHSTRKAHLEAGARSWEIVQLVYGANPWVATRSDCTEYQCALCRCYRTGKELAKIEPQFLHQPGCLWLQARTLVNGH